ncbi:MAG: DUF998 domain-containing protein [Bacteroidia bacterium]|nr:DUF998 domain-containing protein [Bacteroidia bacterium]
MNSVYLFVISVYLVVGNMYWTAKNPSYNPIRQTISELGEMNRPFSLQTNYSFFLPIGILFLWIAFRERLFDTKNLVCGCIGIGYTVSAIFPCDAGCPLSGSLRQWIHNLASAIQYIGSGVLIYISEQIVLAQIIFFSSLVLLFPPLFLVRGLVQRLLEGILLGWLLFA